MIPASLRLIQKYLYTLPTPRRIGAHSPQSIRNFIPARLSISQLNSPQMKGEGRYPNMFFIISPLEFPNARRQGATELIMIPVSPGIIAPPKNKTNQSRMQRAMKLPTKGMTTAEPIPMQEKRKTQQTLFQLSQPPIRLMTHPPKPHPVVGPVMETMTYAIQTSSLGKLSTFEKQSVSQNCIPVDTNKMIDIVSVPTMYIGDFSNLRAISLTSYFFLRSVVVISDVVVICDSLIGGSSASLIYSLSFLRLSSFRLDRNTKAAMKSATRPI